MGDCRTLHFFNKKKYLSETVPMIRDTEIFFAKFLDARRLAWLGRFGKPREVIIEDTIKLISELDQELHIHPELRRIVARKENETYNDFVERQQNERQTFVQARQTAIEFFEYVLIETIFSSLADFNPHFVLEKGLFESSVNTRPESVAASLINDVMGWQPGSILDIVDGGIMNWLDEENVKRLFADRDNIIPVNGGRSIYVNEFRTFLTMAVENGYGFIALRNPSESRLAAIQSRKNPMEEIVQNTTFSHIRTYYGYGHTAFQPVRGGNAWR